MVGRIFLAKAMVGDQLGVNFFIVTFQLMEIYVNVGAYDVKHFTK